MNFPDIYQTWPLKTLRPSTHSTKQVVKAAPLPGSTPTNLDCPSHSGLPVSVGGANYTLWGLPPWCDVDGPCRACSSWPSRTAYLWSPLRLCSRYWGSGSGFGGFRTCLTCERFVKFTVWTIFRFYWRFWWRCEWLWLWLGQDEIQRTVLFTEVDPRTYPGSSAILISLYRQVHLDTPIRLTCQPSRP